MHPLADWNADYVRDELVKSHETSEFEFKSSEKFNLNTNGRVSADTRQEIAKQVSAFSNSGRGYLIFGVDDDGHLDDGVPHLIGGQPIKDWTEAIIPQLVFPEVTSCEARHIAVPKHHSNDRGVLVISIPLSDRRPHWTTVPDEKAYVRSGAHSSPMRPQTLLDIASRSGGNSGEIVAINPEAAQVDHPASRHLIHPLVKLTSGPICEKEKWGLRVRVIGKSCHVAAQPHDARTCSSSGSHTIFVLGTKPLFPGCESKVHDGGFMITRDLSANDGRIVIEVELFTGSLQPARRTFTENDLR